MLSIINLSDTISENIEIDSYIPIKIRWGNWKLNEEYPIYWRIGDLKKSLLEVGISSDTGIIRSLTVVAADDILLNNQKFNWEMPTEYGTPIFDLSSWLNNTKMDDLGLLKIHFCDDELDLILSEHPPIKKVVSGKVCFLLDSYSNIVSININRFTKKESIQIKDTLEFMIKQNKT